MEYEFPEGIGAPATRALSRAGISDLAALTRWRDTDLLDMHGVGPRAVGLLRAALGMEGLGFKPHDLRVPDVPASIADYLAVRGSPQRETLVALRATLISILPFGQEKVSYGLPALSVHGNGVAGYGASPAHCTYVPMSGDLLVTMGGELEDYEVSKGAIRFGVDERLPKGLLRKLVSARLTEIGDVTDGFRREYHPDGRVKAEGAMVRGKLHGPWAWYRADGSLLRTGQFVNGEKSGTWTTHNR